jgi:hypothetical protein
LGSENAQNMSLIRTVNLKPSVTRINAAPETQATACASLKHLPVLSPPRPRLIISDNFGRNN